MRPQPLIAVTDVDANPREGEPGGPAHREVWVRDPDGYTVVPASPDGEAPPTDERSTT